MLHDNTASATVFTRCSNITHPCFLFIIQQVLGSTLLGGAHNMPCLITNPRLLQYVNVFVESLSFFIPKTIARRQGI